MTQKNSRRGETQENKKVVICPPCGESTLKGGKGVVDKEALLDNPPSALRATSPTGGEVKRGFTLIELLVVVLIIGILAAVAVPQYQVAVQKAKLMKYVPIVRALYEAEQVYRLASGKFTANLQELDVDLPVKNCTYLLSQDSDSGSYTCGTERYGIFGNGSNAQAGDDTIRYVQFFADYDRYNMKAGDIACYSQGEIARKACRSLGPGNEQVGRASWKYIYTLAK